MFINDFINNYGLDVRFAIREGENAEFQSVYNIWSADTITNYLDTLSVKYNIQPYKMTTQLPESDNPTYNFHADVNE